ncbi:MAG: hypothetical protein JSV89_05380 [Spirochaetaceae bacterium]|nr:MAG: hypothetical protein JSV89_05380 [Spirochaetaceae bacterium]
MRIALFSTLFVLSVLITLFVLLSGTDGGAVTTEPEIERVPASSIEQIIDDFSEKDTQTGQRTGSVIGSEDALSIHDFMPPQVAQEDSSEPYLLRPKMDRWTEEQVKRYWIPLEEIAMDLIRRENDRRIEKLFEDIP